MSSPRRIRRGTLVIRAWRAGLVVCTALLATVVATPTDRRANASGNPTIDGRFQAEGPLLGGRFLQVDVLGRGGVPLSGVGAVALNITAVNASADTHLSVNGLGAEPATSNLNIRAGSPPVSNMVIVDTVASGAVTITNRAGSVDVLVDVLGWFPIGAFRSVAMTRTMDSRQLPQATIDQQGTRGGPLSGTRDVRLLGRGAVPPTGVSAIALNVTATEPAAASHLTIWPTGTAPPVASSLNMTPGQTVANMVITAPGDRGMVSIDNHSATTHVVTDTMGWFPPGVVTSVGPARLLDTRSGAPTVDGRASGAGPVTGSIRLPVAGRAGVPPTGAEAVILNVTAVEPTHASFITVWPSGEARPLASNLNLRPGATTRSLVISKLGVDGSIDLFNLAGRSHLVVDISGWMSGDSYRGLVPARLLDTRLDPGTAPPPLRTPSTLPPGLGWSIVADDYLPHFGPGRLDVSEWMPPGRYVAANAEAGCTFTRLGSGDVTIATETREYLSRLVVDVRPVDRVLQLTPPCGVLVGPLGALQAPFLARPAVPLPTAPPSFVPVGDSIIETHIPAGTYRIVSPDDDCFWARLSGFGGEVGDLIDGALVPAGQTEDVTVAPTDAGFFVNQACGRVVPAIGFAVVTG